MRGVLLPLTLCALLLPVQGFAKFSRGDLKLKQFTKNGIQFLVAENHALPTISFGVSFASGGVEDPIGKEGLTELTLEMLLRGTTKRNRVELHEAIEYLGANISSYAGLNSAGVSGNTLTRYLEETMALFGEVLLQPSFEPEALDKLKTEYNNFLRASLDDDSSVGSRHFMRFVYGDHPYSRPTDGTLASIAAITVDDLKSRYQQLLKRNLITFYAAGDIDTDHYTRLVDQTFGSIVDGGKRSPKVKAPRNVGGRRLLVVDKPDRSQVQIYIGHPSIPHNDDAFYPLSVANIAFGGFFKSRYPDEIRVKQGWSYHASSTLSLNRDGGIFLLRTFTSEANVGAVVKRSIEMLKELRDGGLTEEELTAGKSNRINKFPFMIDTVDKQIQEFLRIKSFELPDDFLAAYQKRMGNVTLASANRAIREHLSDENLVVVAVCDAKRCLKALEAAIESLASSTTVPYDKI